MAASISTQQAIEAAQTESAIVATQRIIEATQAAIAIEATRAAIAIEATQTASAIQTEIAVEASEPDVVVPPPPINNPPVGTWVGSTDQGESITFSISPDPQWWTCSQDMILLANSTQAGNCAIYIVILVSH
jgi:hypothetical protein